MANEEKFKKIVMDTGIEKKVKIGLLSGESVEGKIVSKGADYFQIDPKKNDALIFVSLSAIATFSVTS